MLTAKQKETLRNIQIFEYSSREEDGKPITHNGQEFQMLTCEEIRRKIFNKFASAGFSKIKFVNPLFANCVVRVFVLKHCKIDDDLVYNIYGAQCFTRKNCRWISFTKGGGFELNPSNCVVRHWLFQDEYIDFEMEFFDTYARVK